MMEIELEKGRPVKITTEKEYLLHFRFKLGGYALWMGSCN